MIHILADKRDAATTEVVVRAFERSFTRGQVRLIDAYQDMPTSNAVVIVVSPDDEAAKMLGQLIRNRGKIILQGSLGPGLGEIAGVETFAAAPQFSEFAECEPAPVHGTSQSRASIAYSDSGIGAASCLRRRHFVRFDFSNEWNNLGYGRIGFGENRWSIAQLASRFSTMVADVRIDQTLSVGAAVTLRDSSGGSVLWFARPVGAIDGQDWSVVETFISAHRAERVAMPAAFERHSSRLRCRRKHAARLRRACSVGAPAVRSLSVEKPPLVTGGDDRSTGFAGKPFPDQGCA